MNEVTVQNIDVRLLKKQQNDLASLLMEADISPYYFASLEGVLALLGAVADQLIMPGDEEYLNDPKNYKGIK